MNIVKYLIPLTACSEAAAPTRTEVRTWSESTRPLTTLEAAMPRANPGKSGACTVASTAALRQLGRRPVRPADACARNDTLVAACSSVQNRHRQASKTSDVAQA